MQEILQGRSWDTVRLLEFGFAEQGDQYVYTAQLLDGAMRLDVTAWRPAGLETGITDIGTGEEYVLHRITGAAGAFVGCVREEYEAAIEKIVAGCSMPDVFRGACAQSAIAYVRETYDGCELEFLWKNYPEAAIWRRQDTAKWFGALRRYNQDTMRPRARRHGALLCCVRSSYVLYASLPRLAAHSACALWALRPPA